MFPCVACGEREEEEGGEGGEEEGGEGGEGKNKIA